ncbi:putative reverse transcriptase domain-containing protein, partial [Tanacetum coccineum]
TCEDGVISFCFLPFTASLSRFLMTLMNLSAALYSLFRIMVYYFIIIVSVAWRLVSRYSFTGVLRRRLMFWTHVSSFKLPLRLCMLNFIMGADMVNTRTDAELAAAVQAAVDAMLPQIREQVREEYRNGASGSGGNPPPVTIHTWLERFNKQKPRTFEKAVTPVDAENWISHMEKIFDVMGCDDVFKARLAVYKFEGDYARHGGRPYSRAKGGDCMDSHFVMGKFKGNSGAGRDQRNRGQQSHRATFLGTSGVILSCLHTRVDVEKPGECRRAAGTCFKCGQAGHLQRDCKKNTGASSSGHADKKPDASGRVFALTQDQAANATGTITGTLFIFGRAVFVLFDTGATHSVFLTKFASCLTMTPVPLDHVLCISTPMKDSARITHVYRDLPLQFNDKIRSVNALLLDMCEFDIILGFIANIHARLQMFLYFMIMPIVSIFQDVFPEELPGILSIRDVEFTLNLFQEAVPISKAPYRLAPIELKELMDQLPIESLERGGYEDHLRTVVTDLTTEKTICKWVFTTGPLPLISSCERVRSLFGTTSDEKSFEELKQRLVSAPILTLPSGSGGFQIYSDASKKGFDEERYHDLKQHFWLEWLCSGMKRDVLRQNLYIKVVLSVSKRFFTRTQRKHDAIWGSRGSFDQNRAFLLFVWDFSFSRLAESFQQE